MRVFAAFVVLFAALAFTAPAEADETVRYEPVPGWVKPAAIPQRPVSRAGAYQILLIDQQLRFDGGESQFYTDTAFKVLNAQGLSDLGEFTASWDPVVQSLVIHRAQIIRGDQVINVLAEGETFSILRREQGLNRAMLDGELTAMKEIRDLRVGDIVRLTTSIHHRDQIPGAQPEAWTTLSHHGVAAQINYRALWPKNVDVRWQVTKGYGEVRRSDLGDYTEILSQMTDVTTPPAPDHAPQRFNTLAELELTGFRDWADVSRMMSPLYRTASTLTPDSPLKAEAAKIRAEHDTPEGRALAALRLVQTEVRYLALLMGEGGLVPAAADETWRRRFGDCKGKTALLLALLKELDIPAEAAAVDSASGDAVPLRLPRIGVFDHVIVRAEIGGKTYWLDGTRTGDREIAELTQGEFGWALPVREAGAGIEKMALEPSPLPLVESEIVIDARKGLDQPVTAQLEVVMRGAASRAMEEVYAISGHDEVVEMMQKSWSEHTPWLKIGTVDIRYDPAARGFRISAEATGRVDWQRADQSRFVLISPGSTYELKPRPADQDQDAPYLLAFPMHIVERTRIRYPPGQQVGVFGRDGEISAGGMFVKRTSKVLSDEAQIELVTRSLAPEVDARAVVSASRAFSQSAVASNSALLWTERRLSARERQANEQFERASALLDDGNVEAAITMLGQVLESSPRAVNALFLRGNLYNATRRYDLALRDARRLAGLGAEANLSAAIEFEALMGLKDYRGAQARIERVLKADPRNLWALRAQPIALAALDRHAEMLEAYEALYRADGAKQADFNIGELRTTLAGKTPEQMAALDRVLVAKPQSPVARTLRGWTQSLKDQRLAVPQYDEAIVMAPDFAQARRLRAAAFIRLEQFEKALPDLDALLASDPDVALYSQRAQVYLKLDKLSEAIRDYDDAIGLDPDNATLFNQRCWIRAEADVETEKALADCNEALRLRPVFAAAYDSRGLVNLRLKRHAEAIADYDSSLARREYAGSLYGRGLARKQMGDAAGAEADLAKARQIDPGIVKTFEGYGLTP